MGGVNPECYELVYLSSVLYTIGEKYIIHLKTNLYHLNPHKKMRGYIWKENWHLQKTSCLIDLEVSLKILNVPSTAKKRITPKKSFSLV